MPFSSKLAEKGNQEKEVLEKTVKTLLEKGI
jgi:hypothetical protein